MIEPTPEKLHTFGHDESMESSTPTDRQLWPQSVSTRADAARTASAKESSRSQSVERFFDERGKLGATRQEVADHLQLPIQSVCSVVKALRDRGRLHETRNKRKTPTGSLAVVLVASTVGHVNSGHQLRLTAERIRAANQSAASTRNAHRDVIDGTTFRKLREAGLQEFSTQAERDAALRLDEFDASRGTQNG